MTTRGPMFRPVRQVAAPRAKSAVSDCILSQTEEASGRQRHRRIQPVMLEAMPPLSFAQFRASSPFRARDATTRPSREALLGRL